MREVLEMAAENKPALKKDKSKPVTQKKKGKVNFKKALLGIVHFFREVVSELKKVSWPTRKEFLSYSAAVIVFVVLFGLIIFVMDAGLQNIPDYIAKLNA
jgi:preprotein translocase subunit SecE